MTILFGEPVSVAVEHAAAFSSTMEKRPILHSLQVHILTRFYITSAAVLLNSFSQFEAKVRLI